MEYMRRVENMPGTEQVPSVHDSCRFGNLERTGTETVLRTESDQGQYFLSVRAKNGGDQGQSKTPESGVKPPGGKIRRMGTGGTSSRQRPGARAAGEGQRLKQQPIAF